MNVNYSFQNKVLSISGLYMMSDVFAHNEIQGTIYHSCESRNSSVVLIIHAILDSRLRGNDT